MKITIEVPDGADLFKQRERLLELVQSRDPLAHSDLPHLMRLAADHIEWVNKRNVELHEQIAEIRKAAE